MAYGSLHRISPFVLTLIFVACRPAVPSKPVLVAGGIDAGMGDAGVSLNGCVPGAVCQLKQMAVVDETLAFRNGAPSVSVSADGVVSVLYARAFGGYDGFLAQKAPGSSDFLSEKLPFAVARGVLLETTPLSLIADDGTVDPAKRWARASSSQWEQQPGLGSLSRAHARAALVDSEGCIHFAGAAPNGEQFEGRYARRCGTNLENDTWSANMGFVNVVTLDRGLGANGVSMVYADYDAIEEQSLLKFVHIGNKPSSTWTHELAAVYKGVSDFYSPPELAFVSSSEGTHHLFFRRQSVSMPPGASEGLFEATRTTSGEWQEHSIFQDEGKPFSCGVPSFPGESCEYTSVEYVPLAAVNVPGAGVRLLVNRKTHDAELEAVREDGSPFLQWTGKLTQDGALWWVWRDGTNSQGAAVYKHDVLASSGFYASRADATVDKNGDVHLVMYSQPPTTKVEDNPSADVGVTWVLIGQ